MLGNLYFIVQVNISGLQLGNFSNQLYILTFNIIINYMVPAAGLEPARPLSLRILSPLCLPFHHAGGDANIGKSKGV